MVATASMKRDALAVTTHDDDDRWAAVSRRQSAADGLLFYSVKTTEIYCRPSSPSRRPRREINSRHAR
jgi:AraC family transcriptional regulator, regulatory protein of adaptative response / methylated-DNA-[protein]-cysteine methyltransferase